MSDCNLKFRPTMPGDEGFVLETWRKSYQKCSEFARKIWAPLYFKFHHPIIEGLYRRATTLIACDPEIETVIYGYLVYEQRPDAFWLTLDMPIRPIVHYVYVKEAWRKMHVATRLITEGAKLDPNCLYVTHLTRDKSDIRPDSPYYGEVRWRGAETLLQKWPLAWEERIFDQKTKRMKGTKYHEGNLYVPYLV